MNQTNESEKSVEVECDAGKNKICADCWGLVEQNCGCPKLPDKNWCKCENRSKVIP